MESMPSFWREPASRCSSMKQILIAPTSIARRVSRDDPERATRRDSAEFALNYFSYSWTQAFLAVDPRLSSETRHKETISGCPSLGKCREPRMLLSLSRLLAGT